MPTVGHSRTYEEAELFRRKNPSDQQEKHPVHLIFYLDTYEFQERIMF